MDIYNDIIRSKKKLIAVLIDPDRTQGNTLINTCKLSEQNGIDIILVGGSILWNNIDNTIQTIKQSCKIPVVIFPGNAYQVSPNADGILFLSLISGRNPDFLIGQQVVAAPVIKQTNLEVIPTGYILVESGRTTAVEYMSNTKPIPSNKPELIVATAIAGEMLGLKMLYIEGGSGAESSINPKTIETVRKSTSVPLMVGGGIRSKQEITGLFEAGADIVVLGTVIEENIDSINILAN